MQLLSRTRLLAVAETPCTTRYLILIDQYARMAFHIPARMDSGCQNSHRQLSLRFGYGSKALPNFSYHIVALVSRPDVRRSETFSFPDSANQRLFHALQSLMCLQVFFVSFPPNSPQRGINAAKTAVTAESALSLIPSGVFFREIAAESQRKR